MVIRFRCPSCDQPIEIDGEWASRAVACPYCRKTVTAPDESTLETIDEIPVANPLGNAQTIEPAYGAAPPAAPGTTGSNAFAKAALVTSGAMILMLIIASFILLPHALELQEVAQQGNSPAAQMEAMEKLAEDNDGQLPGWLVGSAVFVGFGCLTWPVAVVLGILGLYRSPRKHLAIIALSLCGLVLLYMVCSGLAQMAL